MKYEIYSQAFNLFTNIMQMIIITNIDFKTE